MQFTMEQLAAFKAVAETESFTRAAEQLFRTQPAISQAIRSLEETLGQSLFTREGRQSALTQAGRIFLAHVNEVFETLAQGRLRIEALKDLTEGELTISTSDTTAYYILPEVLKGFREKYPGVEIRIHSKPSPISAETSHFTGSGYRHCNTAHQPSQTGCRAADAKRRCGSLCARP